MHSSILILCGWVLTILILSSLILSTLILRVRILCVLVVLTLVVWLITVVRLVVGHVVRIHSIHVLVVLLVRNIGRRLPPTRRSRTADHIGAVSSSLYILPSRQMAVTHRAGLGVE